MKARTILMFRLPMLVLAFSAKADPPTFSNASVQGQYKYTLTSYSLPAKANQPFSRQPPSATPPSRSMEIGTLPNH